MLSLLILLASYLWMLKATPNLESHLQWWQVQSTSKKGAGEPTTQFNRFAYWRAVSDWFYGFWRYSSITFLKFRLSFRNIFLLEIFFFSQSHTVIEVFILINFILFPFIQQITWKNNIFSSFSCSGTISNGYWFLQMNLELHF